MEYIIKRNINYKNVKFMTKVLSTQERKSLYKDCKDYLIDNYNKEVYTKIDNDYFPDDTRCRCCGGSIYYTGAYFTISVEGIPLKDRVKTSSNSKKDVFGISYNLQVCQECLHKQFPELNGRTHKLFNTAGKVSQFAFDIPQEIFEKKKHEYVKSLENYISKFGETEGRERFQSYCDKQAYSNSFEYKRDKYGWTYEQWVAFNKSRAITLVKCIERHGEVKGRKMFEDYCIKQSYVGVKLEYFIETYGEEDGTKRYDEMLKSKIYNGGCFSNTSQVIFEEIDSFLKDRYTTHYHNKNKEFYVRTHGGGCSLDYFIEELNIAIEYNGDYWHANPKYYKAGQPFKYPGNRFKTASEIWEKDKSRKDNLEKIGIKTLYIWESDVEKLNIEQFLKENKIL